ncbi:nuclear transport factor 2 family protein [Sulfuritalea sp.]|uniref:nuclear transport factor 2 family protein n=1 Tax=Sulfuritalea sp. TaxID=2480090 RepID=UPI00286E652D|nr:nuclear transport factor 2 family protein [Sulfuritalea sp.]
MSIRPYNILAIALTLWTQAILGSASAAGGNDRITEHNILSTEKALDDALMQRSVAAFVSHLADNFVYSIERPGLFGKSVVKMTRSEFEAGLAKNLPATNYRSISHEERQIAISQDGREASVTQKNIETVTGGGKDIRAIAVATYKYELRDGAIVLTSLAESNLERQEMEASFSVVDFAPYRGDGPASLEGEAFVKTENGEVRNCSGDAVFLAPYTPFDVEVITAFLFHIDLALKKAGQAAPYWRESSCDSQGKFEFTNVPTGTWIAITAVRWGNSGRVIGGRAEGGQLAKKIILHPGKNRIVMNMKNLKDPIFGFDLK